MDQSPPEQGQQVFDATPYLKLFIDKDGKWFQNNAEIVHPNVYAIFCQALETTPDGGYQVRIGREICRVEVEDAPFVVQRVFEKNDNQLFMQLNDGSEEEFSPDPFYIGKDNVPYTEVKGRTFKARFSRPAYYQLAEHITEREGEYYLNIGDRLDRIRFEPGRENNQQETST